MALLPSTAAVAVFMTVLSRSVVEKVCWSRLMCSELGENAGSVQSENPSTYILRIVLLFCTPGFWRNLAKKLSQYDKKFFAPR